MNKAQKQRYLILPSIRNVECGLLLLGTKSSTTLCIEFVLTLLHDELSHIALLNDQFVLMKVSFLNWKLHIIERAFDERWESRACGKYWNPSGVLQTFTLSGEKSWPWVRKNGFYSENPLCSI
jgi:hypothetical protein